MSTLIEGFKSSDNDSMPQRYVWKEQSPRQVVEEALTETPLFLSMTCIQPLNPLSDSEKEAHQLLSV